MLVQNPIYIITSGPYTLTLIFSIVDKSKNVYIRFIVLYAICKYVLLWPLHSAPIIGGSIGFLSNNHFSIC